MGKGIGWFKLELVTYPDHTCFLDATLDRTSCQPVTVNYEIIKDTVLIKEDEEMTEVNKEINMECAVYRTEECTVETIKAETIASTLHETEEIKL